MLGLALIPKFLYIQRGGRGLRVDLISIMANNKEDLEDKDDVEYLEDDNDKEYFEDLDNEDFLNNNANAKDDTKSEHDSALLAKKELGNPRLADITRELYADPIAGPAYHTKIYRTLTDRGDKKARTVLYKVAPCNEASSNSRIPKET